MGSVAMNGHGDIGLGYSVTGSNLLPSIAATGRLAGDALNAMTQGEVRIVTGSGYQTHSASRWGDYSHLTVDPVDDCTFWYTQEYYTGGASNAGWQTRVGSFKLQNCGSVTATHDVAVTGVGAPASGQVGTAQNITVDVSNAGNQDESVTVTLADSLGATVGAAQTFSLTAGSSTTRMFSWTPNVSGTHVLTATAAIAVDSNLQNNSMAANVTVNDVQQGAAPTISSVVPNSVQRGNSVAPTITGTDFAPGVTVTFTGGSGPAPVASNVVRVDATEITLTVTAPSGGPPRSRAWNLVVTNPDGQSASATFTITP